MAIARHLTNAPIQEALIDFQFQGPPVELPGLEAVASPYTDSDWTLKRLHTLSAMIGPFQGEAEPPVALREISNQFEGLSLTSPDQTLIVQIRSSRITVSRLRSYIDWEELEANAHVLFDRYVSQAKPLTIRRVASRFVNRISPNPSFKSFGDVLSRAPLPLPGEGLEGARIADFLRRHVVTDLPGGFTANLTIGTTVPEAGEVITHLHPMVVDVDVYKNCLIPPDYDLLASELSQIRRIKNALFFGSLTDKGMEQFV